MSLSRLAADGGDFTVTKWNGDADAIELSNINILGYGVVSGLEPSDGGGLNLNFTSGLVNAKTLVSLSSIPAYACPPSLTFYVWVNESGNFTHTTNTVSPGGTYVCLCKVVTGAGSITSITRDNRMELLFNLSEIGQVGGRAAIVCAGANITLSRDQYRRRTLHLTGVLGASISIIVPNTDGFEWTVIDETTGAFVVTIKTLAGTGVALAHTKTCKVLCDGTNVRRVSADV
jgi:hypothetical protein